MSVLPRSRCVVVWWLTPHSGTLKPLHLATGDDFCDDFALALTISSSAASAPREQPTFVTENVAVGGVDSDEDDEDMVEVL